MTTHFFLLGDYIAIWGMFLMIIFLILYLVKQFNATNRELAVFNESLGNQVMERTQELTVANTGLEEINEELNATLQNIKETQMQLIQSETEALLGNLVAGVAHEINTPLASLKSNLEMEAVLYQEYESENPDSFTSNTPTIWQRILPMSNLNEKALHRIIGLVNNLINFAGPNNDQFKRIDLREGLESTLQIMAYQLKGPVEIIKDFEEIPSLLCIPQQINQIFLNLLVNALHAVDGRGRITIRTRFSGGKILISIKDSGPGITPANLARIFQPWFTTKPSGIGTGLGLSISQEIAAKHRGRILVDSAPGEGAEFTLELPVQEYR